jgi:hypothetical protein
MGLGKSATEHFFAADNATGAGLPDGRYVFKPKIQVWVNFGGSCDGRSWYILWTLVHLTVFCYILWTFGIVHGNGSG